MQEVDERGDTRRGMAGLELRKSEKLGGLPTIIGYAAVYDSWSDPIPLDPFGHTFLEKIAPGAFRTILAAEPDVRALREHLADRVLGRTPKTLHINEDDRGLRVEIIPPDTELGRETVELVRRGDIDGMSFSYRAPNGAIEWSDDGSTRIVHEFSDLLDVSVVVFPAFTATTAATTRNMAIKLREDSIATRFHRLDSRHTAKGSGSLSTT